MSTSKKTRMGFAGAVMLVILLAVIFVGRSSAMELDVLIGTSADDAAAAAEHNVTFEGLEGGELEYWAKDDQETTVAFTLTAQQTADILDGTTVMASTRGDGGGKMVSITMKEAAGDSGW
jgi:hypothetical protein